MLKKCICVIVPVYNVEPYIHRCVDSILNQTFTDFELILVDDGSPDNCGKICGEYAQKDPRVNVIHKSNGGQGEARNFGLDWAYNNLEFEWVTFVDSDDWIHNRFLEILYDTVKAQDVWISSCGYLNISDDSKNDEVINSYGFVIDHSQNLVCNMSHDKFNLGVPWGRLYKKEIFISLRFPTDRYYEDGFTIFKALFEVASVAVVDVALYYFYNNPNSTIRSKTTDKKVSDFIDAMVSQIEFYKNGSYWNAYEHEVGLFLYRCGKHLSGHKNDPDLKEANKKFIITARRLIRCDKKRFTFEKYSDGYKLVFNPIQYLYYKSFNKLNSIIKRLRIHSTL